MQKRLVPLCLICLLAARIAGAAPQWRALLDGATPPVAAPRGTQPAGEKTAEFANGLLHITDSSTAAGTTVLYRANWHADPKGATECEGRLKLISAGPGPCGMCIDFADGEHEDNLSFYPDHIGLGNARMDYPMVTTDAFHTYRVRIAGADVQVFVDGKLALDGQGKLTAPAEGGRNEVQFGAGSSGSTGEAIWQSFRFQRRKPMPRKIESPALPGVDVKVGRTVMIQPGQWYAGAFQFKDGRIAVGGGSYDRPASRWSTDGGQTWADGPGGPNNAAIELGSGEVVSMGFSTEAAGRPVLPRSEAVPGRLEDRCRRAERAGHSTLRA